MPRRTSRRSFVKAAAAAAVAGSACLSRALLAGRPPEGGRKPNFIVIFCDDLGYGDLGCYGSKTIRTPALDRMAKQGVRFTDFYAAAPWCSPSRAALLTGRCPARAAVKAGYWGEAGLDLREVTIAEVLREQGYATCCIGKWHLGIGAAYQPTSRGFDTWLGLPWSNDAERQWPLYRDGKIIEQRPPPETLTKRYTEEAVKFITANKDRPFFIYLPHTMPHKEIAASAELRGKSPGGLYGDVVEELDWSAGQILKTLKDLGIDEHTLVIFTSDNGPDHTNPKRGSALPLRGRKGSTWEGGMRVPCVMRRPGTIPAGKVCFELATTMDLLPTLAALAAAGAPGDRAIDGKDIRALLSGPADAGTPHEAFFYWQFAAVRSGKWKLHLRGTRRGRKSGALYDLAADIGESRDVAADHGDVVERLTKLMEAHKRDIATNSRAPDRRRGDPATRATG